MRTASERGTAVDRDLAATDGGAAGVGVEGAGPAVAPRDDDAVGVTRAALAGGHRQHGELLPATGAMSRAQAQGKGHYQLVGPTPFFNPPVQVQVQIEAKIVITNVVNRLLKRSNGLDG